MLVQIEAETDENKGEQFMQMQLVQLKGLIV